MVYPNIAQVRNYTALGDFLAVCKKTGKLLVDYENKSGALSKHLTAIGLLKKELSYKERKQINYLDFFDMKATAEIIEKKIVCCKECGKEFKGNADGSMTRHLKEHNIETRDYVNKYPDQAIHFKNNLLITYGIGDEECKECKFKAQSKAGLVRHINNQHKLKRKQKLR